MWERIVQCFYNLPWRITYILDLDWGYYAHNEVHQCKYTSSQLGHSLTYHGLVMPYGSLELGEQWVW